MEGEPPGEPRGYTSVVRSSRLSGSFALQVPLSNDGATVASPAQLQALAATQTKFKTDAGRG